MPGSGWQAEVDDSLLADMEIDIDVDEVAGTFATLIQKTATFHGPPEVLGGFPPVVISFRQISDDATRFIVLNDEILDNQTGYHWSDFHMTLIDSGDAWFNEAKTNASAGGAGFSVSPFASYSFSGPLGMPDVFDIWGGTGVPDGTTFTPGSSPTDGQLWIETNAGVGTDVLFTLKEFPTIPEPSSILLMLFAAVGLLSMARRRTK